MRIDSHQHFWKFDPVRDSWIDSSMQKIARDFLPQDLKPLLSQSQMEGCVAVQADQSETETQFLLDLAGKNTFIKGVIGWVDLRADDLSERLDFFSKNPLFKGVRHILQAEKEGFMMQDSFLRGIRQLKDFNLTYDLLVFPHQLEEAIALVKKNPDQLFVLDHLAKPYIKDQKIEDWAKHIKVLAKHKNVYCKLSGMVTEADWNHWRAQDFEKYLSVALETFGSDRLMFGSDWPVCLLAGSYQHVVQIIELFVKKLKPVEQNKIMGENARSFYKL
ncbi:MAG: amidohydrolase [Flavobacteriaceae bacterium TMED42]|nr:MAG: amidohydrolase [Flavobacteriaceae bacterium TMED42]|tara:strand:+ start:1509 stop:2333 length:825 start_codon:yes stop_codon:yes gene_type:complete